MKAKDKLLDYRDVYYDGKNQYWFFGKGFYREWHSDYVYHLVKKGKALVKKRFGRLPEVKEKLKSELLREVVA